MKVIPNKGKNVARKWYTDLDINLTAHPQSGDLTLKQDKEAVKRSLRNILLTNQAIYNENEEIIKTIGKTKVETIEKYYI